MKDKEERKAIAIVIAVIIFASLVTFVEHELGYDVRWYVPTRCIEEKK